MQIMYVELQTHPNEVRTWLESLPEDMIVHSGSVDVCSECIMATYYRNLYKDDTIQVGLTTLSIMDKPYLYVALPEWVHQYINAVDVIACAIDGKLSVKGALDILNNLEAAQV